MFGLEDRNKKKEQPFVFEIEKDWKDPQLYRDTLNRIQARIQSIKNAIQGGEDKEHFDQLGLLLQGYSALLKVMARVVAK